MADDAFSYMPPFGKPVSARRKPRHRGKEVCGADQYQIFVGVGSKAKSGVCERVGGTMNLEKTIAEIEWLERLFTLPDNRPLQLSDLYTVNQRHDEMYANNPWFRLWKRYGV
jgi:hypothetical protein